MTVTLELRPEEVDALRKRAAADGVDIETVLHRLVAQAAASPAPQAQEKPAPTEKQKGAVALMQAWRAEDQTDDPEELAARDQELEEFAANINRWRAEQGRPVAFERVTTLS